MGPLVSAACGGSRPPPDFVCPPTRRGGVRTLRADFRTLAEPASDALAIPRDRYSAFERLFAEERPRLSRLSPRQPYYTCRVVGAAQSVLLAPNYARDVVFCDIHADKSASWSHDFLGRLEGAAMTEMSARPHWGRLFFAERDRVHALSRFLPKRRSPPSQTWRTVARAVVRGPLGRRVGEVSRMSGLRTVYRSLRGAYRVPGATVRQALALRRCFRDRVSIPRAEEEIRRALAHRQERFLEVVRTQIFERPASPYRILLNHAGCTFADLHREVQRHGLEPTLSRLAAEGVYLTANEFKGKVDVVRGSKSFRAHLSDFARPDSTPGLLVQSSGSSNAPMTGRVALDWLSIWTFSKGVFLAAHDLLSSAHAVYDNMLPAPAATYSLFHNTRLGIATDRWFAQRWPVDRPANDPQYLWSTALLVLMGKCFGAGFPRPELLPFREFQPVLDWISKRQREGKRCCLDVTGSNAVRIARIALDRGISLEGTTCLLHGEPYTDGKREIIERAGARCTTRYSFSIGMNAGHGCARPAHIDEVHVNQYMLAVIAHPRPLNPEGPPVRPLLFTTLYPQAALMHLNVENGDYATLEERACGCGLERVGLTLHLHRIRSYEKFTAEGWTYFYGDLYELVERTLPAEFGGGPGHYQLIEEEDESGLTRLTMLVDPEVGALDEDKLSARVRAEFLRGTLGDGSVARAWWYRGGTFRVRRETPRASSRGKILPLQIPH